MFSSTTHLHQFVFDDVIVDCENFRVQKAGEARDLTPRAFDVLVFLVENHGRVVEKQELFENVWKEKFVSDNALTRSIKEVRHAIGDSAESPRYIETVPRRGYRFVASVSMREINEKENIASTDWPRIHDDAVRRSLESVESGKAIEKQQSQPWRRRGFFTWYVGLMAGIVALSLAAWFIIRPRNKPNSLSNKPIILKNAQITTWTGLDLFPSLSPDGNAVAYTSDHTGKFEIYVRALMPGARENQLTSDGQQNLEPSWSPDGKWIAYYSLSRGGIWLVPAGGGVARQLVPFGSRPAWSRDGSRIAFQSDGLNDISSISTAGPTSNIWIISARGGDPYPITQPGNPIGGHGSPSWSPDGNQIAFVTNNISRSIIWRVSPTGADLKQITPDGQDYFDPSYSPDGRNLLVVSGGVWRIPLSENGEPAGMPEQVAHPALAQVRNLSFSADGKRIVSSLMRQKGNLWSVSVSKSSGERVGSAATFVEDTSQRKTNPIFSTDGSKVAYSVWIAGAAGSIWTVGADGSERTQLTTEQSILLGWLPYGNQLASITFLKDGQFLTTTTVDTGMRKMIRQVTLQYPFCRLSPNGKMIAFNAYGGSSVNLWLYSVEEGTTKQLTFDKELLGFPAWSPDSKWIAAEMKRNDDTYVALVPVEGGTPVQLNSDRGQSWTGSWSPDGDKIAFAGSRNGVWNIWWISRLTREQKQVTNYTRPNSFVRYPTWSPRGDQIVYEYSELTGNIWMAELK